jgi:hypothetical protein
LNLFTASDVRFLKLFSVGRRTVDDLLPQNGFSGKIIDVGPAFNGNVHLLPGENMGKLLWEDTTKIWLNTSECFNNCSEELRNKVPTTWGGLMEV